MRKVILLNPKQQTPHTKGMASTGSSMLALPECNDSCVGMMAGSEGKATNIGASLICSGALIGVAVSVSNYLSPDSGIGGTPGAVLVILSTAILCVLAVLMRSDAAHAKSFRIFLAASSVFDIIGTAFAGHLLNSETLVALMAVCLLGWLIHLFTPRPVLA